MALIKKLTRIGNSLGIILPTEILQAMGINEKSQVEISVKEEKLILKPVNLQDHKVMKTFLKVLEDYDDTFKKLAK